VITNFTIAEENYIKVIYHLQNDDNKVTTNEVAAEIKTTAASVTDMLKKLKEKNILNYEKYKGFRLSTEGKKIALNIIRKHRLWEYFLVEKLHFKWDEIHAIAEELEHVSSKKLIDNLEIFLGYPKFDPHGDPIPNIHGKLPSQTKINLQSLPQNIVATITSVGNQSSELLELLTHKKMYIGTSIEVKKKFPFDHSIEVKLHNKNIVHISNQLAQSIFVTTNKTKGKILP
jgi:DtxR family Mn-dependent transcriptional regulator